MPKNAEFLPILLIALNEILLHWLTDKGLWISHFLCITFFMILKMVSTLIDISVCNLTNCTYFFSSPCSHQCSWCGYRWNDWVILVSALLTTISLFRWCLLNILASIFYSFQTQQKQLYTSFEHLPCLLPSPGFPTFSRLWRRTLRDPQRTSLLSSNGRVGLGSVSKDFCFSWLKWRRWSRGFTHRSIPQVLSDAD